MSIKLMVPSNHLILCCPILLLPPVFPNLRIFSNELALCIRWLKYQSFSIRPSSEYSVLISFRIDWFDVLAVQVTQESPPVPQFESINFSVLRASLDDYYVIFECKITINMARRSETTTHSVHTVKSWVELPAAAAKLLQSCPTLCNHVDGSAPGSPVPGILQASTLEWVAISFSSA